MSHYATVKTQYRDQAVLIEALEAIFGKGNVEVHSPAVKITGYMDRPGAACEIIVRRKLIGNRDDTALGDIGFQKQPDGTFTQHIDDYDHRFVKPLAQQYARGVAIKQAKRAGWTVVEEVRDGKVHLNLSKWSA